MKGYITNIEEETIKNTDYRRVLYTTKNSQLVLINIKPGDEIGEEVHELDQFIRLEAGQAQVILDDIEHTLEEDFAVETLQASVDEVLSDGKPEIPHAQKEQIHFDKRDKLKYIKSIYNDDPTTSNLMLFNTVFELTEVIFDLKREWTPAPKQRLQCISELDEAFSTLLREFYLENTTTERRWELLDEMTNLVL